MKFALLRLAHIFEAENPRLREGAGFDRSSLGRSSRKREGSTGVTLPQRARMSVCVSTRRFRARVIAT